MGSVYFTDAIHLVLRCEANTSYTVPSGVSGHYTVVNYHMSGDVIPRAVNSYAQQTVWSDLDFVNVTITTVSDTGQTVSRSLPWRRGSGGPSPVRNMRNSIPVRVLPVMSNRHSRGRNSSLVVFWVRCPQRRGFDPPLGKFSRRGDFSLGGNMGSNSIPPKNSFG